MRRPLATAALAAALALPPLAVVWAGLGWPPPLWIVEYGLPASHGPTGRVARIGGVEFVEFPAGHYWLPGSVGRSRTVQRLWAPLRPPGSTPLAAASSSFCELAGSETVHFDHPVWLSRRSLHAWELLPDQIRTRLLFRGASLREELLWRRHAGEPNPFRDLDAMGVLELRFEQDGDRRYAFSLGPDQEHLVEPYLVEGN